MNATLHEAPVSDQKVEAKPKTVEKSSLVDAAVNTGDFNINKYLN